jgi:hypothetical protein
VPESLVQDDLCSVFDSEISVAVLEESEQSFDCGYNETGRWKWPCGRCSDVA